MSLVIDEEESILVIDDEEETNDEFCTICQNTDDGPYVPRNVSDELQCEHRFHLQCILGWESLNVRCPNCRAGSTSLTPRGAFSPTPRAFSLSPTPRMLTS